MPRSIGHTIEQAKVKAKVHGELFGTNVDTITIDRFQLLERVGAGGMGVVYAAYDPKLDRKVAIKFIRTRSASDQELLLVEAQTLARVVHPNVVSVFDVGIWASYVYIVMEFVRGVTLRNYAATKNQTVRSLVSAYLQAGQGLLASHSVGIIHRDFKPDNAMIGKDGRVRILDFGLARRDHPSMVEAEDEVTIHSVAGTPGYMAPEIVRGEPASFAADQFAFCASLGEALNGLGATEQSWLQPWPGTRSNSGASSGLSFRPHSSSWLRYSSNALLRAALVRGTERRPADRFPSLQSLLHVIERSQQRVGRFRIAGMIIVAAVLIGWLVRYPLSRPSVDANSCSSGQARIDSAWDPQARRRSFERIQLYRGDYGEDVVPDLRHQIDRYVQEWASIHDDACMQHREGAQSANLFDRRRLCLDRAYQSILALAKVADDENTIRLTDLVLAVQELPRLQKCSELEFLLESNAESASKLTKEAKRLDARLNYLRTQALAGDLTQARDELEPLIQQARDLDEPSLVVQTLLLGGRIDILRGQRERAIEPLTEATHRALEFGMFDSAVEAWARRSWALATSAGSQDIIAQAVAGFEWIESLASGLSSAAFSRGLLYNNLGGAALAKGDRKTAREWFRKAMVIGDSITEPGTLELLHARSNLALVTDGPYEREKLFAEAIDRFEQRLGRNHPFTLSTIVYQAARYHDPELARSRLRSACKRYERFHPGLESRIANCRYQLAQYALVARDFESAYENMLDAITEKWEGSSQLAEAWSNLLVGDTLLAHGRFEEWISSCAKLDSLPWWEQISRAEAMIGLGLAMAANSDLMAADQYLTQGIQELMRQYAQHQTPILKHLFEFATRERERIRGPRDFQGWGVNAKNL